MHTAEHILNRTMVEMFGCPRSRNAHIERKKSKCDYELPEEPTAEQLAAVEAKVNEIIARALPVTVEFVTRAEVPAEVDVSKLPGRRERDVASGAGGRLRCVCLHRRACGQYVGDRCFQNHQPRL